MVGGVVCHDFHRVGMDALHVDCLDDLILDLEISIETTLKPPKLITIFSVADKQHVIMETSSENP